jgi:hypothetical protein
MTHSQCHQQSGKQHTSREEEWGGEVQQLEELSGGRARQRAIGGLCFIGVVGEKQ